MWLVVAFDHAIRAAANVATFISSSRRYASSVAAQKELFDFLYKVTSRTMCIYFAESHWVGHYLLAERDGLLFVLQIDRAYAIPGHV